MLVLARVMCLFMVLSGFTVMAGESGKMAEAIWIDVRSAGEFEGGHYSKAVNIPYTEIKSRINELTDDKNADIRVYCRSGRRSGIAKKDLEAMGFTNVTNEGGYSSVKKKMAE